MGRPRLVTLTGSTDVYVDPAQRVTAVHVIKREDGSEFLSVELEARPEPEHTLIASTVVER